MIKKLLSLPPNLVGCFHEITGLVSGALSELDAVPEEIKARFGEYLMTNIYREANQEMEVQNLLSGFARRAVFR